MFYSILSFKNNIEYIYVLRPLYLSNIIGHHFYALSTFFSENISDKKKKWTYTSVWVMTDLYGIGESYLKRCKATV